MTVKPMDYGKTKLLMEVSNEIENSWRLNAAAKEPWTVQFIEDAAAVPGSMFWDIGANVGSYTLIAASQGLRVNAVEPGYNNVHKLIHNLNLNGMLEAVMVWPGAVGDGTGVVWFEYSDLRAGAASHILGGKREHASASTRREVYVSPERKQAMMDAGYWEDPELRKRMLKRYAEADRNNSSR